MTELPKLNIICPNCGSPNYTVDCSSVSQEYKIKCTNCGKYYKNYDEVIKLHKEKLDEAPDSQKEKELYEKFCQLFPQFSIEEQTINDIPVIGLRCPNYMFIYRDSGDWKLHFKQRTN